MVLLSDCPLPTCNWSTTAIVAPALNSLSRCDARSDTSPISFSVPVILLSPAMVWPVSHASTRVQHMPLFGYPFNDRHVVLQVRGRYVYSQLSDIHCIIGEMSPYCAGDYFELPVFNLRGDQCMTNVTFVCALVDSKTKTWLVIHLTLTTHIILCLQSFWSLQRSSTDIVYLVVPLLQTWQTIKSLKLPKTTMCANIQRNQQTILSNCEAVLRLTELQCRRSSFDHLRNARKRWTCQ